MRATIGWSALALAVAGIGAGWGYAELNRDPRPAFSRDAVAAAIADPARTPEDRAADARRHPAELLELSGVRRDDKVFELIPGTGYFTRLLSKVVGPKGRIYAVWPQQYARYSVAKVDALKLLPSQPGFANVVVEVQPTPEIAAPEPLDIVFTSQNYHDYPDEFMGKMDPMMLSRAAFKLLKPGGAFIVIDHMARPGAGTSDTEKLHRIDPATVRSQAEAAGFRFDGETRVLANPADPLTIPVFDPSIRGHTSQFAYRFLKPR
jgi:predicted methyltransferase